MNTSQIQCVRLNTFIKTKKGLRSSAPSRIKGKGAETERETYNSIKIERKGKSTAKPKGELKGKGKRKAKGKGKAKGKAKGKRKEGA